LLVAGGYCSDEEAEAAQQRISVEPDLARAVAHADLVSESIVEQVDIKRDVHTRLDQVCPAHTVLTSNSSALLVSDLEEAVTRGDKFAALHSHLGSPLFDIVGGPRTAPEVIQLLARYVESLRCVPLIQHKEHPGYVLNAMLGPLLGTALSLVIDDGLTVEQVDRGPVWPECDPRQLATAKTRPASATTPAGGARPAATLYRRRTVGHESRRGLLPLS
jgi:3-hydroxybutyryl-CoA dehydrogenase